MDFGVLPPEVTSGQLYSGAGSGPLMAAAAAWDVLGGQVGSFAQDYASLIAELQGGAWAGSAAAAMAAAAGRYARWAAVTGGQAEQAAAALRGAAGAFEVAHAAITPPEVVAANRAQLMRLIATNVLGQNAARIAAVEAAYQGMWAQNTAVMYGYAGSAASASRLAPFQHAPQTTNPAAGTPATGIPASAPAGIPVPQTLVSDLKGLSELMHFSDEMLFNNLRTMGSVTHATLAWIRISSDGAFYAPLSAGLTAAGLTGSVTPATSAIVAGESTGVAVGSAHRAVLAGVGEAATIGRLSTPPAWADATSTGGVSQRFSPLAKGAWEVVPTVSVAGGAPAGMVPIAQAALARKFKRPTVSTILQVAPPRYTMPRPSAGG